ncbi:MAG: 4-hydroxy-tetrahydrodipicolinate reductase [Bacillota bacterium]|nr:MAG: 4-hydroxy-tetrahydrodipicolinate reductase [Bacillota bacterium]
MKVILCGACGRMGRNVAQLCSERGVTVTAGVDVAPAPMPFPVYPDFSDIREEADVVIDFSPASSVRERLDFCKARKIGIVIAGTAFSDEDEALIRAAADVIPVFQTGNLSVGVNLLQMLVKKAAEVLGDGFDAEIVERHHNMKKDAPSGTALMLAKSVNEGFGGTKENVYGRHGLVGARKKSEIGIHAVRGGTIVGEHEVMFAGQDEIVTLSHSARSRMVFAEGALRAAEWLTAQPAGKYDMNDLLAGVL